MAYEIQTWVDGADGGTPISAERLNHMEAGIADGQNASTPTWETLEGKPDAFAPAAHTHDAGDIGSGTFATARIPSIAQSKVTGLGQALSDLTDAVSAAVARIEALEAALEASEEPTEE